MNTLLRPHATPAPPGTDQRADRHRFRLRLSVVIAVALAGIALLAVSGLNKSLVLYRTPTELVTQNATPGQQVRLGGLVERGTLHTGNGVARFVLTDGVTSVPVVYRGQLIGTFAVGQDALVQGKMGADRRFHADLLMVKHSDTYRAPDGNRYTPPKIGGGGS